MSWLVYFHTTAMTRLDKAYDSLHALFGRAVVVAHLMEDLITATDIESAAEIMMKERIDVVGTADAHGVVRGLFSRAGYRDFEASELLHEKSSLKEALVVLRERPHLFVQNDATKVIGIVTRADLQKPPFRLYCFGLITLLEMHLLQVIRAHYVNDDDAVAMLTEARARKAHDEFERRKLRGLDITVLDCLQFADKRDIVAITPKLRADLGFTSIRELERMFDYVNKLRDDLAHGQLLDGGREWTDIITRMIEVEALLNASLRGAS